MRTPPLENISLVPLRRGSCTRLLSEGSSPWGPCDQPRASISPELFRSIVVRRRRDCRRVAGCCRTPTGGAGRGSRSRLLGQGGGVAPSKLRTSQTPADQRLRGSCQASPYSAMSRRGSATTARPVLVSEKVRGLREAGEVVLGEDLRCSALDRGVDRGRHSCRAGDAVEGVRPGARHACFVVRGFASRLEAKNSGVVSRASTTPAPCCFWVLVSSWPEGGGRQTVIRSRGCHAREASWPD